MFLRYRPVLVIGGSCDVDQESMGAFQEYPQVRILLSQYPFWSPQRSDICTFCLNDILMVPLRSRQPDPTASILRDQVASGRLASSLRRYKGFDISCSVLRGWGWG